MLPAAASCFCGNPYPLSLSGCDCRECDPDRGPGAFKIAETVVYRFPNNGSIHHTARICCIARVDLEEGVMYSAWGGPEGDCPDEYSPFPAYLLNSTL